MHETVFAHKIITEAKNQGNVKEIDIEIGELAHVPAQELLACLKQLVPWNIISSTKEAKIQCDCGFIGHPTILERGHDFYFIECPKCSEVSEPIEGTDIKLLRVVVE